MSLELINYVEDGLAKNLSQFAEDATFKAIITSILTPLQDTQASLIEYVENNNISDGRGVILDNIGKIVGERRLGRSDESYRTALRNRIVINTSEGSPNKLLEILTLLSGGDRHRIYEHFPLTTSFYTNGVINEGLPDTLLSASPITTNRINIYHDPVEDSLIPCELTNELGILVNQDLDEIVTDEGRNIAITYLSTLNSSNNEFAILPESTDTEDIRIPCEMYISKG